MFNSITVCRQDYNGDVELANVLLDGQIAVDCDENVEPLLSQAQQITIFAPGPPTATVFTSCPVSAFFSFLGRHSSSNTRTDEHCLLRLSESCNGLLAAHARKVVEEVC